jgi:hypothetical protein
MPNAIANLIERSEEDGNTVLVNRDAKTLTITYPSGETLTVNWISN